MAHPDAGIKRIIDNFIRLLQTKIEVKQVYLFGSCAKGNAAKYSDIDLAIVSSDFANMTPFERLVFLGKVAWEAKAPVIEAIGYTPREFLRDSPLDFTNEIKENGISIRVKKAA